MNATEAALARLSTTQQERVRVARESLEEGLLTEEEFVAVVSSVVLTGNVRAYALGAVIVAGIVERTVGTPQVTPAVPSPRHLDEGRVRAALATVLASNLDTVMQLDRIADNEPKQAAADGAGDFISSSEHVDGWTRTLDSGACDLCQWWAAESPKFPPHARMARHTGCACTQTPVVETDNDRSNG